MKRIVTISAVLALLLLPSAALASGSSTCQSYNPQLCEVATSVAGQSTTTPTTPTATTSAGTLPFTGLDVGLLVAGGGVLLCAGLVVRRLSRDPR